MMSSVTNKTEQLKGKTIVIVGASSGIGRATALEMARGGAHLVLASRREAVLAELAQICEQLGARATYLATNVTNAEAVRRLAVFAIETFGGIDVWINNAGAGVMGNYDEIPIDVHDQVIRTSLMGHLHGAHAVLPHFKERGKGILINTISIGAYVPEVYGVAYTASKYGLRGYSEALRAELREWPGIKICDVFPSYIDTPGFQHAANYTGKKLRPVPPVYTPERVARTMVSLATSPKNAVIVGESGHLMRFLHSLFPRLSKRGLTAVIDNYFHRADPVPLTNGALYEPLPVGTTASGGWRSPKENLVVNLSAGFLMASFAAGIYFLARRR